MRVKVWTFVVGSINEHLIHSLSSVPVLINVIQIKMIKRLEFDHENRCGVYRGQWKHSCWRVCTPEKEKISMYIYGIGEFTRSVEWSALVWGVATGKEMEITCRAVEL